MTDANASNNTPGTGVGSETGSGTGSETGSAGATGATGSTSATSSTNATGSNSSTSSTNPFAKEILGARRPSGAETAGQAAGSTTGSTGSTTGSTGSTTGQTARPSGASAASATRPAYNASASRGPAGVGRSALLLIWLVLLLIVLGVVAGGYWLNQRFERSVAVQSEHDARTDAALADTRQLSSQSINATHKLEGAATALGAKVGDIQNQQQALQQLYQDLARNRDDWVMTDAEQTLSTANQQLQLTGNVQLALYALQNADAQLATTDAPQVLVVRRAVAADIDKLKAAPVVDLPGLALRLDQAISQVDTLPLAGDVPATDSPVANGAAAGNTNASNTSNAAAMSSTSSVLTREYWSGLWQRITHHFGESATRLVQVRRIDRSSADAMLVAPEQAAYLRENVKLRLLSARLSLLSRNVATMQSDLSAADDALARYFDPSSSTLGVVRSTIADVRRQAQQVTVPDLEGSLQALRQYKSRG